MNTQQKQRDVQMFYIADDISKIQTKTNLYIKQYGPAGAFHLTREVVQNAIDELMDHFVRGKHILITYDLKTDTISCEDDGRGFPETDYPMDIFCTKIQSGSKFFRDQSGVTSGEFGLGLTAVCALAREYSMESWRESEKTYHIIKFENGKKVFEEQTTRKKGDKKHGCRISFSPSKKYLGEDTHIPYEEVLEWVELQSYLIPEENHIEIVFEVWDGTKLKKTYKISHKPFEEILKRLTDDEKYSPKLHMTCHSSWTERARVLELDKHGKPQNTTRDVDRKMDFEVVLRYIPEMITKYDSFCNFTNTFQGGVHQNAFDEVFCRTVIAAAKEAMTEAQWEKYKPTWDDVRAGLCCVINLNTNAEVGFVGNVKEKIDNQKLMPILKAAINKSLKEYFDSNKSILESFVKITRANAKARVDLQKVKEASQSSRMDRFSEHMEKKFIPCNNSGKNDFRELFIVEGESAVGSAVSACDHDTQAFFLLKGCTKNVFKVSFSEAMENEELRKLRDIIQAGIGDSFDVNKMWYQRINIMTDSDIDGYNITLGILGFLYQYMRPAIEAGRVYKVMAPLYRIKNKGKKEMDYVTRRSDITEIFFKNVTKAYKVYLLKNAGFDKTPTPVQEVKNDDLYEFLDATRDYKSKLELLADTSGEISPRFLECVLSLLTNVGGLSHTMSEDELHKVLDNQKFITKFCTLLQRFYPEATLEGHIVQGTVEGVYLVLDVNLRLLKRARDLLSVYNRFGYRIQTVEKGKDSAKVMSLLEFLTIIKRYDPDIRGRFKGLGELNPEELWETVLNINNRTSIQYTVDDVEKEMEIFQKLLSDKKKYASLRKDMMKKYRIAQEDLDN